MKPAAAFFWRRLDQPGHDSCRLFRLANGWRLGGAAIFRDGRYACHLNYEVVTDAEWKSRRANVSGFVGKREIDVSIRSTTNGRWQFNGEVVRSVTQCIDIDLGFTPATNMIALRRLSLRVGESADAPAAYLRFPNMRLERLAQTYRRVSRTAYAYRAPTEGYAATLQVSDSGAIVHYPQLFESEIPV